VTQPATTDDSPVRDPVKLRRTALILTGIMVLGGTLVFAAYQRWAKAGNQDTRPSFVHRIRKERDLRVIRQDGSQADLLALSGKVWVIHVDCGEQPDRAHRSREVMKRLASHYATNPDFALVTLMVDPPPPAETIGKLKGMADSLGAALPQWWVATNEAKTLHKFIQQELKANVRPYRKDGSWTFDTSITLVDRQGHVRRAVVPQQRVPGPPYVAIFDFDEASSWDARKVLTGTNLSNEAQLERLLRETIELLLAEPAETT
jgi:cytochrome oxidase Cu insertion factor (SCO1/SenC/PrrC family)